MLAVQSLQRSKHRASPLKKYINKTMKALLFILTMQGISFLAIGQETVNDSIGCDVVKNIKFKGGTDTLEFTVIYRSFISGDQDPRLPVLSERKQILADEFQNKNYGSTYFEFMLPNCNKRYMGILDRKIYDRTFVRKHIGDFQSEIVDLNNLETYQRVFLKCVVFEDQSLMDRRGSYFFAITELTPL